MAAKELKRATENLTCPVCYQVFRNPKYLTCYHSYCEECLEKMQNQSKILCPECRKETAVPAEGVKQLPNNFFINRLVDEFILKCKLDGAEEEKCNNCEEDDPVVSYCPDGGFFLCQVCHEAQKQDILSRGHGIVTLTELQSNKDVPLQAKVKVQMCKDHDYELEHYCETCEELVCLYCTMKEHSDHNHDTVKKMVTKHRNELKEATAPVDEMIRDLSEAHDNIDKMTEKIRKRGDEVDKKIDQHYDELVQKLMKQKEELKQQARDAVSQKEKALRVQLGEVEYAQAEVLSIKELTGAIEKGSDQEAFSAKKQVFGRMQQITNRYSKLDVQPSQSATMEFLLTAESFPLFGSVPTHVDPGASEVIKLPSCITVGNIVEFSIITKYHNGSRCSIGGSEVSVQLESNTGETISTQVRDNDDGRYMASFVAQQTGEVKLLVSITGQQIKGSPYRLTVVQQCIDYTRVKKVSKIVNNGGNMGHPRSVAFGKNGIWSVVDSSRCCVYIYDNQDQLVYTFGNKQQFKSPVASAFDDNNYLFVIDRGNNNIRKFDINGTCLLQLAQTTGLRDPVGITVHNNRVYIADYKFRCVFVFQTDGEFCHCFGRSSLKHPYDIAFDTNNTLFVAGWIDGCIYSFTQEGKYIGRFGGNGRGQGQLYRPSSLTIDSNGFILVAEFSNHRISVFDKTGKFVHCFGSEGCNNGQLQHPFGIALSPDGKIYVCDTDNKRIQIFSV